MYMMTNEKLVGATNTSYLQPKDVGSFLLQVFVDVYLHGTTDKLDTLLEKLKKLFTVKQRDLFLMAKVYGINDFTNLNLLPSNELIGKQVDLTKISQCFDKILESKQVGNVKKFDKVKKHKYMERSPCLNITGYPECKAYCDWHTLVVKGWSTLELQALER